MSKLTSDTGLTSTYGALYSGQLADRATPDELAKDIEGVCLHGHFPRVLEISPRQSEDDREKAKAWKFDEDRPQTVLLYVDPLMSAECALAILETVHWATDISYATPVRVIIVSNAPLPDSLKRLIRHYGHKSIRKFTFEVPEETMEERRAMYKIIVCYSPWKWIRDLPEDNQGLTQRIEKDHSLNDRLKNLERIPHRDIPIHEPKQVDKNKYNVVTDKKGCIILQLPPGYRMPSRLDGFGQIHLCISTFREQTIFDPHTEQLTRVRLLTSQEERREQVSLAFRTVNPPFRVAVYCDEVTVDNFLESGASERCLKICNEHAPGFLLSLVFLMDWGNRRPQYHLMFLFHRAAKVNRSDDEGPASAEESGVFNSLGDSINARAHIVQQLLPILDFNYRLTVLHDLQSLIRLFNFPHRGTMSNEEYRDSLVAACHGWTWPLAHTGSMWLAVGLWKHGATIVRDHNMTDSNERALTALSNTFISSFIAVLPDFLAETEEMTGSECSEIQKYLAWAYIHQIVETRKLSDGKIVHQLGASTREPQDNFCVTLPPWAFDGNDYSNFIEEDGSCDDDIECIMGVFHGMSREFAMPNLYLDDWTYIPGPALRHVSLNHEYWDVPTCTPNLPRDNEEQQALSSGFY
ncbi:uncharacterized protein FFUJ_13944 [Fusarium fujikuroi IMI 58289]|uniref:Uncharacterized protein n=1 Tax=Gibberella fujikuroi (strain CBS 195.34 / IMI 58289 / NRRL A-6831) TaxID=1279085 RepID=S0EI70_GIBF5|nr:uncharacterized protein FFUJ_13944 [Fusarium fujikuroi IMI 58289]KLO92407.1 uncharacterized protein LW93_11980 [Fusarium fujikuroi]KLO93674.1 uncharacterized protein Y057_12243 [Fusarium fujikuroi]KLO99958.1 uncharacterized protein LW94_9898 [Fusarium fujikuroi]CCT72058.1 uncharacterized protein FFUJ_13944 [Fusarium fujikuroi IMI 58289]